jgi:thiamine biosynthesis lipoprotein
MELDFGAIGKGYAADKAVEILKSNGIKSALLDFGGNIQAVGKKPDGSLWRVGIKNPWEGGAAAALSVESKAVVTSGGYERYFEKDGVRYIHIFDPKTGCPSNSNLESVTIVCESGKYADALSTALFVMGKEVAIDFYKANTDFDFVLVTKERELIYSAGLSSFIKPLIEFSRIECVSD